MPALPERTAEQRREAYERSLQLRQARAAIKGWLALREDRASALSYVFESITEAQGMKVVDLLRALPGIGPSRARNLMLKAGILEKNIDRQTVSMCGPKQREKLFSLLAR